MLKKIFNFFSPEKEEICSPMTFEQTKAVDIDERFDKLLDLCEKEGEVYVVVVGLKHYFGEKPFSETEKVYLIKDPSNPYDSNAIKVVCDGFGTCGYVANSPNTVRDGALSADLIYDCFSDSCIADSVWCGEDFAICRLVHASYKDLVFNSAVAFLANNEAEKALRLFLRLNEICENINYLHRICECYFRLSDLENAAKYLDIALRIDAENVRSLYMKKRLDEILTNTSR